MRQNTPEVINAIMDTVREHQVHLKGVVSTVVITTMVLEGWSTKLNPEVRWPSSPWGWVAVCGGLDAVQCRRY